jgi:hypothetical protein
MNVHSEGSSMISTTTDKSITLDLVAFDLPDSPTLRSVFVAVRHCGDKAIVVQQPQFRSKVDR